MLTRLRIKNAWVHQDVTFTFKKGHTLVTGRNGRGKSLIPEFIQFALWGIKALRGKSEDYKGASVELDWTMKGHQYSITRTTTKALLRKDREPVATGTKPVNKAVREIFGYSFEVFQISNAANQGSINRLGDMLPTDRKRMVDETIGLNVIDTLEAHITDNLKSVRARLEAVRGQAVKPEAPVRPEGYVESGLAKAQVEKLRTDLETVAVLRSQAAEKVPEIPGWSPMGQEEHLEAFLAHEDLYKADKAARIQSEQQLKNLPVETEPAKLHASDAEYDALVADKEASRVHYDRLTQLEKLLKGKPMAAPYTTAELDSFEADLNLLEKWKAKQDLINEADKHKQTCPNCQHEWVIENPLIEQLYGDVPQELPAMTLVLNHQEIAVERKRIDQVAEYKPHFEELQELMSKTVKRPDGNDALIMDILSMRQAVKVYEAGAAVRELRKSLQDRLAKEPLVSLADTIQKVQASLEARKVQQEAIRRATEVQTRVALVKTALAQFPEDLQKLYDEAASAQVLSAKYDSDVSHYSKMLQAYNLVMDEIAILEEQELSWTNARPAMAETRTEVKSYLLPSLNVVASNLLAEMSGGELAEIIVNEDFDITAISNDGSGFEAKRLETLSGAGKAVANLALRLGLGQVLTNRTFPVVMLDEIDASCDDIRSKQISDCVARLSKKMDQVIVISHKPNLVADHRIEL